MNSLLMNQSPASGADFSILLWLTQDELTGHSGETLSHQGVSKDLKLFKVSFRCSLRLHTEGRIIRISAFNENDRQSCNARVALNSVVILQLHI